MPDRRLAHLTPDARRWVRAVERDYALTDTDRRLVVLCAEAMDRAAAARDVLDRDGTTYLDRFDQPRPRPENAIERDAKLVVLRYVRALGLHDEEEVPDGFAR